MTLALDRIFMRNSGISFLFAASVVLAADGLSAQTISPLSVNFRLTAQAQGLANQSAGGNIQRSTIIKYRLTSKDVINLLQTATGLDLTGHKLVVDDNVDSPTDGNFFLTFNGAVVTNVTAAGFMSNFFDTESEGFVYRGRENTANGSFEYTDVFTNTIEFEDSANTNRFSFGGAESFFASFNSSSGRFQDSFTMNGSGTGEIETNPGGGDGIPFFVLTGSVTGSLRGSAN